MLVLIHVFHVFYYPQYYRINHYIKKNILFNSTKW